MSKARILVVDDDPNLSDLVRLFLERTQRYEVRIETRPAHAFTSAREFQPDMILLDVDMPGKDGGDVALEFQTDAVLAQKPVLFFTSLVSPDEAGKHAVTKGGMRFLAKPVNPTVLIEAVDGVLAALPHAA